MKIQHEQLVMLEEKCRKMKAQIKDRKQKAKQPSTQANQPSYSQEDLEVLNQQLKDAEIEKVS